MAQLYFSFWANEYLSDGKIRSLTYERRGILQTLWAFAWNDGSIPSDAEELGIMLGINVKAMRTHCEWIAKFFQPHPSEHGRLVSPRLELERAKIEAKGAKARESAQVRWQSERNANAYANASETDMRTPCVEHASQSQIKEKEVPPLAPKGAPAEPASQGKPKRTPRKPLQSEDCTPDVLPHVQAVYKLVPKMHPVSGEEVHKGPFATAARAIQRLVDEQALTPKEAEWVGKVYYTAEDLEAEFPEAMRGLVQAVSNAWDTRPKAMMQVSTLFGPEKKPWAQLLPVARKAMARVPVLLEVSA